MPWRLQMMLMLQTRSVPTILMWRKPFNASHIVSFRTDTLPHPHHSISDQLISQFFLTVIDNLLTNRELEGGFFCYLKPQYCTSGSVEVTCTVLSFISFKMNLRTVTILFSLILTDWKTISRGLLRLISPWIQFFPALE